MATSERIAKLFKAALEGNYERIDKYSRKYHMDMNLTDMDGNTLLHHACYGGHEQIVGHLLPQSRQVNSQNMKLESPLHIACANGSVGIVSGLLRFGANPTLENQKGENPLHYACLKGNFIVVPALLGCQSYRVNINSQAKDGTTALMWATRSKSLEIVNILVHNGANISLSNNDGVSPLHWAACYGTLAIVKVLLDAGAQFTLSHNGNSPLHAACIEGDASIVSELLRRGADHTKRNLAGKTPGDLAREFNHQEYVTILERNHEENAKINSQLAEMRRQYEDCRIELERKGKEFAAIVASKDLEINSKVAEIAQLRSSSSSARNSHDLVEYKIQLANMDKQLKEALAREQALREEHAKESNQHDARIRVALVQTADDAGLDLDSFLEQQVLRRNIVLRMREHRFNRLHEDISRETDFDTLRSLGAQLRALQFDPNRDLKDVLSFPDIHDQSLTLLASLDRRWRELLTRYENEELSERCRINREEFQVLFRKWEKIVAEEEFIRHVEELKIRCDTRSTNPAAAQITLEELTKLSSDLQRIELDDRRRQNYETLFSQIRATIIP